MQPQFSHNDTAPVTASYSRVARALHWSMALLISWAVVSGLVAHRLPPSPEAIQLFVLHKSAGITVLGLAVVRILWRLRQRPPALALPPLQQRLAQLGHWGLYGLLLLVPLSGWLANSAAGYPFAWFGWLSVPSLPWVVEAQREGLVNLHRLSFYVIALMVVGHVLMLWHHKKAQGLDLLGRMLPFHRLGWGGFMVLVVLLQVGYVGYLGTAAQSNGVASTHVPGPGAAASSGYADTADIASGSGGAIPQWQRRPTARDLTFSSRYAGEAFTGAIEHFEANIHFDPQRPDAGMLEVHIDTTSLTTYNGEWDSALGGSQWFAIKTHPSARFFSDFIRPEGDGFIARGQLTLKGISRPVTVPFQWREGGEGALFEGRASIDRRDFAIGSGSWLQDDSIAFMVELNIALQLQAVQ